VDAEVSFTVTRIGLVGSFGFGNLGDEAIPLALSDLLNARNISADIVPISRFNNVALSGIVERNAATSEFIANANIMELWHVGGGIAEPGDNSVLARCGELGELIPHRILAANVASNVRYGLIERYRIRRRLLCMKDISVRDAASLVALNRHFGIRLGEPVGDLVLWLEPDPTSCATRLHTETCFPSYVICNFCSAWISEPGFVDWAASVISLVHNVTKLPIVLFPMSEAFDSDTLVHRRIFDRIPNELRDSVKVFEGVTSPREAMYVIGKSSLVVGMRLHSTVMAYACHRPFVGIEYNRKVGGFASTVGLPNNVIRPHRLVPLKASTLAFSANAESADRIHEIICDAIAHTHFDNLESLRERTANVVERAVNEIASNEFKCV